MKTFRYSFEEEKGGEVRRGGGGRAREEERREKRKKRKTEWRKEKERLYQAHLISHRWEIIGSHAKQDKVSSSQEDLQIKGDLSKTENPHEKKPKPKATRSAGDPGLQFYF